MLPAHRDHLLIDCIVLLAQSSVVLGVEHHLMSRHRFGLPYHLSYEGRGIIVVILIDRFHCIFQAEE